MSDDNKDVKLLLKVMINHERNKVLFAEADSQFVDIVLSFLTLPLGRIVKVLEKYYGDKTPTIGSLRSLYHGLANLDTDHFWTVAAKNTLLDPTSSFEDEYERLKIDFTDSPPAKYFCCTRCTYKFRSLSVYYDTVKKCEGCGNYRSVKTERSDSSEAASIDRVFTNDKSSFIISDDLQILPVETGLLGIINILGITDMDKAEPDAVDFGLTEIMNLLKASLTSPTPLLDVILNKTTQMKYSAIVETQPMIAEVDIPDESRNLSLKLMIQKSTGKFLYAQAKEDFVEFLFSFFHIPLGEVEHFVGGKTCMKTIDNLYRSTADLIEDKFFKCTDAKKRLMRPNLAHGCISKDCILPLIEKCLPADYTDNLKLFSSYKFPNGQGRYLKGPRTYEVKDDLTVTPFYIVSILSSLRDQKIPTSDVIEMELQIGLKEALRILKFSLTSTCALTNALLNQISNKQPKTEV